MTSTGLAVFDVLCRCGNEVEALRERCREGGDAWTALTQILQAVDCVIDCVVNTAGFDDDEDDPTGVGS